MGKPVNKTLQIAAMSGGVELGHVSGPIASFRSKGDPLQSLLVNIDPVQEGSGDPSPDNVRPISGWSAVNVWRTGKNLFDPSYKTTSAINIRFYQNKRIALPPGIYTMSGEQEFSGLYVSGDNGTIFTKYNSSFMTFELTELTPVSFKFYKNSGIDLNQNCQLELGSLATPYEPYQGDAYTIQLGQTVYGATLDVTAGKMVVSHVIVKLGNWMKGSISNYSSKNGYYYNGAFLTPPMASGRFYSDPDTICSHFAKKSNADSGMGMRIGANNTYFYFAHVIENIPNIETSAKFCEWLEANDVFMTYPLATPIEIPLTPTEISTLQGPNNVWADTGDVDVTYVAVGGEGGKLALLLRKRKELLIALRKGLTPAEAGLLNSTPLLGGFVRPGLSTDDEKEEDELV